MKVMVNTDEIVRDLLTGDSPLLDSFAASVAISRIGYPKEMEDWFDSVRFIPAFAIYSGESGPSYYRAYGCHELLPFPSTRDVCPFVMHMAVACFDFAVHFMSTDFLERTPFYEYFPAVLACGQCRDNIPPPKGGRVHEIEGRCYLDLFHHTTHEGKAGIIKDRVLRPSKWNFCGTRKLARQFCYLTDIPEVQRVMDTLPMLIRTSETMRVVFRSDDQKKIAVPPIAVDDRVLDCTVHCLVSPDLIQPNPFIFHAPIDGQPKWLEIAFPHIYRVPSSGLRLTRHLMINGEQHWVCDRDSPVDFRADDPITSANGNSPEAMLRLIDECHMVALP
jgi:hypothetical protein